MGDRDDFLAWLAGPLRQAETALHDGDAEPRMALWSAQDPATLFGAWKSTSGPAEVREVFRELAGTFSDCTAYDVEVLAAEVSGDLAYSVCRETTQVRIDGEPRAYRLRVTQVYRREDGGWRVVHRHGDPDPDPGLMATLGQPA